MKFVKAALFVFGLTAVAIACNNANPTAAVLDEEGEETGEDQPAEPQQTLDATALELMQLVAVNCHDEFQAGLRAGYLRSAALVKTTTNTEDGFRSEKTFELVYSTGMQPPNFSPVTDKAKLTVKKSNHIPDGLFDHPGFASVTCELQDLTATEPEPQPVDEATMIDCKATEVLDSSFFEESFSVEEYPEVEVVESRTDGFSVWVGARAARKWS